MNLMTQQLNKDTGKFWSFKDTKHYKNAKYKNLFNTKVERRFIFEKSYLVSFLDKETNTKTSAIPMFFKTSNFPLGYYCALGEDNEKVYFKDEDIIEVFNESQV